MAALRDPMLATLTEEAQARLGRTLSHAELSRLAGLYLNEDFSPEVILLCAARLSSGGKKCTLAALDRELHAWRSVGVESGEEAERYIALLDERAKREEETAALFGLEPSQLTLADRRSIRRWYEELGYRGDMIAEALAQAALADKKRAGDSITLVIPQRIGECELRKLPVSDLLPVIRAGLEA